MAESTMDEPTGDAPVLRVRRTAAGAEVVVNGEVRATYVGDLDEPRERAAFEEMVAELFPGAVLPPLE